MPIACPFSRSLNWARANRVGNLSKSESLRQIPVHLSARSHGKRGSMKLLFIGASFVGDKANSVVFDNSKIKGYVPEYICEVIWSEGIRRSVK